MTGGEPSELEREIEHLKIRLGEAEQTLDAIRSGEVDSLVVETPDGLRVYALEGASNTYRVLMEAMTEGAATLSENGVVLYCNGRFAELIDKPLQRVMGSSVYEHLPKCAHEAFDALLRAAEDRETRGELPLLTADGHEVPAYLSANAIHGDGRRVLCLVAVDLREQKRDEEILAEERLASSVLMQVAEAIVVCDDRGRIIRASRTATTLCGTNPLFSAFDAAFPLELSSVDEGQVLDGGIVAEALGGQTFRAVPARLLREDCQGAELLVSAAPLRGADERVIGCVVTLVDVTEHHRAARALQHSESALREADRRKNEFLAVLSHELRNPLAPIVTALQILERVEPGGELFTRAHDVIARQVRQLARLVDDLLDVTRIARGKIDLERERVELNELVSTTVDDYRASFQRNGVHLEVELANEPVWVDADPTRLAQVVGNLLQNAAKFAGRGERTRVCVARSPGGHATIRVADTGPGIAPPVLEHLFEPFTQADVTLDRSKGGLGLGLALVKWLVEMHDGEVRASSAGVGQGAAFTVSLPLVHEATEQQPRASQLRTVHERRILIIEDNVDAAASLRDMLRIDQHEVEVAHTGPEGLARARAYRPDVVLCDIGLPEMDGYQVARALRSEESLRHTYLVAITGYATDADSLRARDAGFDWHMAKPPNHDELEQVLAALPRHTAQAG